MIIQQILMTPEYAKELLKKNSSNRKIRRSLVVKIRQDIEDQRWHLTHQPIAIDHAGCILDGQHRLTAIVEAGKSVPLMLATDCNQETMIAIDTGNTRSVGDILTISGTKNAALKAAIVKLYRSYYDHPNLLWSGRNVYSVQAIDEEISKIKDFDFYLYLAKKASRDFNQLIASALAAFMLVAVDCGYPVETIEEFVYQLSTGQGTSPGDPVYAYRQYLINSTKNKYIQSKRTQRLIADFIKVFNSHISNSEVRKYHPPSLPPMPKFL